MSDNDRILVIDDDRQIWQAYKDVLAPEGPSVDSPLGRIRELMADGGNDQGDEKKFNLAFASQGQQGFDLVQKALANKSPYSVIFLDIRMPPGWDGMETAARIRRIDPLVEIVIVTAFSDRSRSEISRALGSSKFLFIRKPFDAEELRQLALSLSEKWNIGYRERQHRNALIQSEARFRALVETTSDWVWEVDLAGTLVYCSPVSERIFGYDAEELEGKNMFAALRMEKEDSKEYEQIFADSTRASACFQAIEHRCLHRDGWAVTIESSGTPVVDENGELIGFRGIDRDITARKQAESEKTQLEMQYRQSQKLEALGTLAGGIAHDMNNILTPIMGYCEFAQLSIGQDHPLQKSLEVIDKSAKRAAGLIRQILTFSRKQIMQSHNIDLNGLIKDFSKMLKRLIREDVDLQFDLAKGLWNIEVDISQMEQVLLNLVVNARDALSTGGHVVVTTRNENLESPLRDIDHTLFRGEYVVMSVSDDGEGIDENILKTIFDPFFTTKEKGKGTGMGLATVYGIVKQHDGFIRVDTAVKKGTTFHIYLPKADKQELEVENIALAGELIGGHETVLLVEDDEFVLDMARESLIELGYSVLTASNGNEALALFIEREAEIDLVLTDVVMPGMGGPVLVMALRKIKPNLPVLYMTGYASEQEYYGQVLKSGNIVLQKPFEAKELANSLRKALNA